MQLQLWQRENTKRSLTQIIDRIAPYEPYAALAHQFAAAHTKNTKNHA